MTPPDDMVTWQVGVLDEIVEDARSSCGRDGAEELGLPVGNHIARHDPRSVLARVEAERGIIAAWEEQRDFNGDPEGKMAAWIAVRWLAYGHRHDAPGWRQEWTPEAAS